MRGNLSQGQAPLTRPARFDSALVGLHICAMQPNLSPEDYAAIAALLRDTIAASRRGRRSVDGYGRT